jgi:hypothetical protein
MSPTLAKALAENMGLKLVIGSLISRLASECSDPEEYVLTLTAPLRNLADANPSDPDEMTISGHLEDLADYLENRALGE